MQGEPLDIDAGLTPVKGEGWGINIRQEDSTQQNSEKVLGTPMGSPQVKIAHQKGPAPTEIIQHSYGNVKDSE